MRDDSNSEVRFAIRDLEKFQIFYRNYYFTFFQKIRIFSGFTVRIQNVRVIAPHSHIWYKCVH